MSDHAPLLERLFDLVPEETTGAALAVEGALPGFVRGEYLINGPAQFRRGDLRYRNWLDGDGMVLSLRLGDGPPRLTARYVQGDRRRADEAAGKPVYRAFGTAFPGDQLLRGVGLASPVNVSVLPFGGAVLAFGEQGLPVALDPVTLATRGAVDLGGLTPITPFSAHPALDPVSGDLYNFGVSFARERPLLHYFRISPGAGLTLRNRAPLPYPASIHDFSLTPRHAVFYVAPHVLAMEPLMAGASVLGCLQWRPELGARLVVLDRDTGAEVASIPLGDGYCLHHVNAFEDGERLVVDVLELEEPVYPDYQGVPDLFTAVKPARLVRLVADPRRGELLARERLDLGMAVDFPNPDPRRAGRDYRDFWALAISATGRPGRKFLDTLVHVDWRAAGLADAYRSPAPRYLGGEPVFVPAGPGREGVVICQEFDAERLESAFLVFDALAVARGPIARLRAPTPVHLGFHAVFTAR